MDAVLGKLREHRLVPVIVVDDAADAVDLGRALVAGGLPVAEVTFRTAAAAEAMRRMSAEVPELLIGAGTVLTPAQVTQAREAGASFVVSPGFNPRVVDACREQGLPVYPGVATPTEIEAALEKDLSVLKFFPAESLGGLAYLKAVAAPYGGVSFMPTGGISPGNVRDYLAFPAVVACGGSWLAPKAWIQQKQFDRIRDEVRQAVTLLSSKPGE
jgi:2-dehydro-3-deoxyphosphogluconate aldolase/(4S)-4-hydroxy-2-oxoglutarate aldolase